MYSADKPASGYGLPAVPAGNNKAEKDGNCLAKHLRPPDGTLPEPHAILGRGGGRE